MTTAKLPGLESLLELSQRHGVDVRPTLARVLTDLYVQKAVHSVEEERHYTELMLRMIDLIDEATRTAIAASLAGYRSTPAALRERLGIAPPDPVEDAPPAHPRRDADDGSLELCELFFAAGEAERRLILTNLDLASLPLAVPLPVPATAEAIYRLEAAALRRSAGDFIRTLARTLAVSSNQARRIVEDLSGEPVVVAAKVIGMPLDVLQRVLLFINPVVGQSVNRVYDLSKLYEELKVEGALRMLEMWRRAYPAEATLQIDNPAWKDDLGRAARMLRSSADRIAPPRPATPGRQRTI